MSTDLRILRGIAAASTIHTAHKRQEHRVSAKNYDPTPQIAQAMVTLATAASDYAKGSVHWYVTGPDGQRADVFVVVADTPLRQALEDTMRSRAGGQLVDKVTPFVMGRNGAMRPLDPQ